MLPVFADCFFVRFGFLFFFFNFFIFGCVGSSFLCKGSLQLRQAGTTLHHGTRASHYCGLSCCGAQASDAQAQQLWLTGLVAPRHVGSSQTRARTRVPCICRQILNHCATRETLVLGFLKDTFHYIFSDFVFTFVKKKIYWQYLWSLKPHLRPPDLLISGGGTPGARQPGSVIYLARLKASQHLRICETKNSLRLIRVSKKLLTN